MTNFWINSASLCHRIKGDIQKLLEYLKEHGIEYGDDNPINSMEILDEFIATEMEEAGVINRLTRQPNEILRKIILHAVEVDKCRHLLRLLDTRMKEAYDTFAPQECKLIPLNREKMIELPFGWLYTTRDFIPPESILNSTYEANMDGMGADLASLAQALSFNSTLTSLTLRNNSIGNEGVAALAAVLRTNSTLTTLDLTKNLIRDEDAEVLATALQANSSLTFLTLYDNIIGDVGAKALVTVLQTNSTLTSLSLGQNKIGDESTTSIINTLQINPSLRMYLWYNSFGNASLKLLRSFKGRVYI